MYTKTLCLIKGTSTFIPYYSQFVFHYDLSMNEKEFIRSLLPYFPHLIVGNHPPFSEIIQEDDLYVLWKFEVKILLIFICWHRLKEGFLHVGLERLENGTSSNMKKGTSGIVVGLTESWR